MESGILRVSCKVSKALQASLTLQETQSIHDSMNIPKIKFIFLIISVTISADMSETKKLWKNIEPHLKKALQTLYLREVSSSQWERYQQELEDSEDVALHGNSCFFSMHPLTLYSIITPFYAFEIQHI